jgi:hypothetical protein
LPGSARLRLVKALLPAIRPADCEWEIIGLYPFFYLAGNWRRLLTGAAKKEEIEMFRRHERTGRVLGDEDFQKRLEKSLGRVLRR